MQRAGITIGRVLSLAMLVLAGLLSATVAALTGGWIYGIAVAWALVGIVVANTTRQSNRPVACFAALLAPVVLAAPALA